MTMASNNVDDIARVPLKTTTTVAMDFGRVELEDDLLLYLFGTPGQERFWFMWDNLVRGALGAVVLVDTRRLEDSFTSIDFFGNRQIPYAVVVNKFDGLQHHSIESVRKAMALDPAIPIASCDARVRSEVKQTLTHRGSVARRVGRRRPSSVPPSHRGRGPARPPRRAAPLRRATERGTRQSHRCATPPSLPGPPRRGTPASPARSYTPPNGR